MKLVDIALHYAKRGWRVFPIHSIKNGKCTCGHECASPGKHPLTKSGFHEATTSPAQIKAWWGQWPWANIGIRTGKESGIVVLDIDQKPGAEENLAAIQSKYGSLPDTLEAKNGGGGRHIFFKHPGVEIPCGANILGIGIDIRGDGGYIVAPPSKHILGRRYEWDVGTFEYGIAEMPSWMVKKLQNRSDILAHTNENTSKHKTKVELTLEQQKAAERVLLQYLPGKCSYLNSYSSLQPKSFPAYP